MLRSTLVIAALISAASLSAPCAADIIYLRGEGQSKGYALRGSLGTTDDGKFKITKEDGTTLVVEQSRVISVDKDDASLPPKSDKPAPAKAKPAEKAEEKPEEKAPASTEAKPSETKPVGAGDTADTGKASDGAGNPDTPVGPDVNESTPLAGFFPTANGTKWEKTNGTLNFTEEIIAVEVDGKVTTLSMMRSYEENKRPTSYWKIICTQTETGMVYARKDGAAAAEKIFEEPCTIGSEWKSGDGYSWRVTSVKEAYTDRGGKTYQDCLRVDRINSLGAIEEGQQAIYASGVGRVNDGLVTFHPAK